MSVISNCELTCDPNVRLCIDLDLLCSENDRLSGSSMSSRISLRALSVARRELEYLKRSVSSRVTTRVGQRKDRSCRT